MSEEAPKPPQAAPSGQKTSKAVIGMLLINLGATGFVTFKSITAAPADPAAHAAPAEPSGSEVTGPVVALDPFVVNLDEPGQSRYLKVTLQLELLPESEAVLEKSKQLLRDSILSYLSGLHLKDTLGSDAKDKIRGELMTRVNKLVGEHHVRRMFFGEFVVQ